MTAVVPALMPLSYLTQGRGNRITTAVMLHVYYYAFIRFSCPPSWEIRYLHLEESDAEVILHPCAFHSNLNYKRCNIRGG